MDSIDIIKQADKVMDYEMHDNYMQVKKYNQRGYPLSCLLRKRDLLKYQDWLKEYTKAQEEFLNLILRRRR